MAIKQLGASKFSFGRRFVAIFGIIIPMAVAFLLTAPIRLPQKPFDSWTIHVKGVDPEVASLLIINEMDPNTRVISFRPKNQDYFEFQMILPNIASKNQWFDPTTPDVKTLSVTTRGGGGEEKLHGLVITSASQTTAEAKLSTLEAEPLIDLKSPKVP